MDEDGGVENFEPPAYILNIACPQAHTMRQIREINNNLDANLGFFGNAYAILWLVLVSFCIISAIIFSCADGVNKEKDSDADPEPYYGAACAAGCGAGCGA
ncbi:hypothetical protein RIF29_06514 [Crotalaria pallida]|uniref:Uncharacterized protein n=1 Tax=Crotalaria pallida TaxID=3830 RepID=A0AAN9J3A3_CROPI